QRAQQAQQAGLACAVVANEAYARLIEAQIQARKHLACAPAQMQLPQLQQGGSDNGGHKSDRRHSEYPKQVFSKF
ncbi:MAG: hypothetical protein JSS19_01600, partial [Proteobacteria bacterium]|nr:hypothetical protein [Pseudomonadota bacterium]